MNGKLAYFKDQNDFWYEARTLKELKTKYNLKGRICKLYEYDEEDRAYHVGYCIGYLWLTVYFPLRTPV